MSPPTIYELCQPRADVLEGRVRDEDFAADLSQVLKGTAPELYKNPAIFFANTHPTRGLRDLFLAVVDRLTGSGSQLGSILRLDTSYGGGKTHGLIGLRHILTAADQIPNLAEFIDQARLPRAPVTVAAFDGENADPMNGRRMATPGVEGDILAFTPWAELAVQLAGATGYERIRNSDRLGAAPPGAETLRELIGERPVLILIDELLIYLRKIKGPAAGQAAEQLTPFLTDLIKAVASSPQAVLVFTLALGKGGQAVDAYAEENQRIDRIFAELESVTGRQITALTPTGEERSRAQITLEELLEQDDPYAVSPEDALDAARREVKAWRMEKLTSGSRRAQLDPLTEWFVLAWDAFEAPQFPFDEALRLARVVGLDLDKDVVGVLAEKKASDLILWDSSTRATKGKLGAPDGTKSWIDAIHHCAHRARSIDLNAAKQLLDDNGLANSADFLTALEAVLEVLPLSARYTGFDPVKAVAPAASDFEALENLRRLALAEQVPPPKQLELVLAELVEAS